MALQFEEVQTAQQGQSREQMVQAAQAATIGGSYTPPNTSAPVSSNLLANGSPLNFQPGGTPENGSSAVAAAVGANPPPNPESATPGLDGDFSKDPTYQTAQASYDQSVADYKSGANAQPSEYDTYTQEMNSTGATQNMAEVKNLQTQLDSATAEYNNLFAKTETQGIKNGVPALFWQGEIAAQQRQAAILTTGISSRLAGAQKNYDMAERLAEKHVELKFKDAQRKIDNKLKFIELNKDNLTRAEKVAVSKMEANAKKEQAKLDKYKENVKLALTSGLNTKFINKNGEFFDANTGKPFSTPEEFFKAAGVTSFEEAYAKKLVGDNKGAFEKTGVASYDEWMLYKKSGGTLGYNDYQTMDLNRKAKANASASPQAKEEKVVDKFNTAVSTWKMEGTREQFIRQLKGAYPKIEPADIERKVYEIYPNGYDN